MIVEQEQVVSVFRTDRTNAHLRALPGLVAWLLGQSTPSMQVRPDDGSMRTKASFGQLPLREGAVDAADELYALVVDACTDFAEQMRRADPTVFPPVAALAYFQREQNCRGIPVYFRRNPAFAEYLTETVCDWLIEHSEDIARLNGADDYQQNLHERVRQFQGQFPSAPPEPHAYRKRACDLCDARRVYPEWSDDPERPGELDLKCSNCGRVVPVVDLHRYLEAA